jgi:hypothetical protein
MANLNELKKYHFIYKTTNLIKGEFYIGMHSTNNLNDDYLGSGKRLKRSINKYGKENFKLEVLEYYSDRSSLALRENELVNDSLLLDPKCINLRVGGTGGFSHEQQIINSKKGNKRFIELMNNDEWRNNQCKKQSIGQKEFLSKNGMNGYWDGKKHSNETIMLMKKVHKGKNCGENNSQYNTRWITNGNENKKIKTNDTIPIGWSFGRVL